MTPQPLAQLLFREPTLADGAQVAELVRNVGTLEPNTTYAYLLLSHHFSSTCRVVEQDGRLVACVLGYRLPEAPRTLFLWQIGVLPELRGRGVGLRLLDTLLDQVSDLDFLEATIAPSNRASMTLFRKVAQKRELDFHSEPHFEPQHFGAAAHEAEHLIRVGPLRSVDVTLPPITHAASDPESFDARLHSPSGDRA